MRLIDADALMERHCEECSEEIKTGCKTDPVCGTMMWVAEEPTIDAVTIPCKIGDLVYGIREYKGVPNVQKGFVSEMFFTKDMKLMIVIKYVCRGYWLDRVFPTYEAAEEAIRKDGEG